MTDPSSPTPTPSDRVRSLQARISGRVASVLGSSAAPTAAGAGDSAEGQYFTPAAPHDGEFYSLAVFLVDCCLSFRGGMALELFLWVNGDRREGGSLGVGSAVLPEVDEASSGLCFGWIGEDRAQLSSLRETCYLAGWLMGPALPPDRVFWDLGARRGTHIQDVRP